MNTTMLHPKVDAYTPTGAAILLGKERLQVSSLVLPGEVKGLEVWRILAMGPAVEQSDDPNFRFEIGELVMLRGATSLSPVLVEGYAWGDVGVTSIAGVICRVDESKVRLEPREGSSGILQC